MEMTNSVVIEDSIVHGQSVDGIKTNYWMVGE